jgi:type III secretion protein L
MAFFIPHQPLKPRHRLAADLDPATRIVRASDLASWVDAQAVVDAARAQADEIVAGARAAFDAERQRGYEEGREQARREGAHQMAQMLARTDHYFEQVEERLATLVMQAIRKIVNDYSDEERVVHSVRNALAAVRNRKQITLRVHPSHVDHVRARTAQLLADYPGVSLLDVVGDSRLGFDTCMLECDIGVVEATTEGQLAALESALRQARGPRE